MNIVAVDTALSCTGCALFDDGELKIVSTVRTKASEGLVRRVQKIVSHVEMLSPDIVVAEQMQIYRHGRSKGDPNKLAEINTVLGGFIRAFGCGVRLYRPAEWKRQLTKEQTWAHIPKDWVAQAGTQKDILDAVALGCWFLGRMPWGGPQ